MPALGIEDGSYWPTTTPGGPGKYWPDAPQPDLAPGEKYKGVIQSGIAGMKNMTDYMNTMAAMGLQPVWEGGNTSIQDVKNFRPIDTVSRRAQALAEQKFGFQKDWINRVGGIIGQYADRGGANSPAIAPGPQVTPAGVFSPEEMIAQQNMIRDRSMQQAAGMEQRMRGRMASRGAAVNSPLLAALQNKLELGARVGGEQGALDFSRQAAEANARNILQGQSLSQQIHDAHQKNLISRFQAETASRNQLLQILTALGGIL